MQARLFTLVLALTPVVAFAGVTDRRLLDGVGGRINGLAHDPSAGVDGVLEPFDAPPVGPIYSSHGHWSPPWGGMPAWELPACPPWAYSGWSAPWEYPMRPYQFVGYRWVRADDTTCSPFPSDNIYHYERANADLPLPADEAPAALDLSGREYRVARIFYRSPPATHSIYYHDQTDYTGRSSAARVQVRVANRSVNPPLPWESEAVRISFDGLRIGADVLNPAYQYDVKVAVDGRAPSIRAQIVLMPLRKVLTAPDPNGVSGRLEKSVVGKSLRLVFGDRWASVYKGQRLAISYVVKRHRRLWGDTKAFEGVKEFSTASEYQIDFSGEAPLEQLKPGDEYYAEFSFRRLGNSTSSDEAAPTQKLPRIKL